MVLVPMVVFRRRSMGLHPVNRTKHVVDFQTAVPLDTIIELVLVDTVDAPTLAGTKQVAIGSKINAIFMTCECVASETSTTATANFYFAFYKNPGTNFTFPKANAIGASDTKNHVIHQEMVMINPTDGGNPRNIFKGVIVIPKGMRRNAPKDRWVVQLFIPSTGVAALACLQAHYKEFR